MRFIYSQDFATLLKAELQSFVDDNGGRCKTLVYSNSFIYAKRLNNTSRYWNEQNAYFKGAIITIVGSLLTGQKFNCANNFAKDIDLSVGIVDGASCSWLLLAICGIIGAGHDYPFVRAVF